MPILENIKTAEEKAEKIKEEARKEVDELLHNTRKKATEEANKIIDSAKAEAQKNDQATLESMKSLEEDNLKEIDQKKNELTRLAMKNQEVGVNFILKRVVGL